jgi:hypothetical protein
MILTTLDVSCGEPHALEAGIRGPRHRIRIFGVSA